MGKRSRKRGDVAASPTTRAERDAARQRRAAALARDEKAPRRRAGRTSFEDRPPAPWGSFPLVEIAVLIGIVLLVSGFFFVRGERGATMIIGGLALASLGGLELSIREHFSGFRSHSSLLAGAVAAAALAAAYFASRNSFVALGTAIVIFGAAFWLFRRAFMRRSGGVAFRR